MSSVDRKEKNKKKSQDGKSAGNELEEQKSLCSGWDSVCEHTLRSTNVGDCAE